MKKGGKEQNCIGQDKCGHFKNLKLRK